MYIFGHQRLGFVACRFSRRHYIHRVVTESNILYAYAMFWQWEWHKNHQHICLLLCSTNRKLLYKSSTHFSIQSAPSCLYLYSPVRNHTLPHAKVQVYWSYGYWVTLLQEEKEDEKEHGKKIWMIRKSLFEILHDMPTFPYKTAQNSQTWQLQALWDTYTYSTSAFVPTKTLKVRKIHSYNNLQKLVKPHFCSTSPPSSLLLLLLQLNWPTAKVPQVLSMVFTQNGSFPLRAWSLTNKIFVTLLGAE